MQKIQYLLVYCFGFVFLIFVVCKFVIFEYLLGGCLVVYIISGGNDVEQCWDGDYFDYDQCYVCIDVFFDIVCQVWISEQLVDIYNDFYQVEQVWFVICLL